MFLKKNKILYLAYLLSFLKFFSDPQILAASTRTLIEPMENMAISNAEFKCNRWTHFPANGQTLFITEDASIIPSSKRHNPRKFPIVDIALKDLFCELNHGLYFDKGYGGKTNHLFVSLRIGFIPAQQKSLAWNVLALCWDEKQNQFAYYDYENPPLGACYADFYNIYYDKTASTWQLVKSIDVKGKKVKFVAHSSQGIGGVLYNQNHTHSEPGALGFISTRKDLVLAALQQLQPSAKIKLVQIGLHSLLDFCEDCNPMVHNFQEAFQRDILAFLQAQLPMEHPFKVRLLTKPSHVLFMLSGINNRLYNRKRYYFYDAQKEWQHPFRTYYLQRYRPFGGELPWNKKERASPRLLTFVNEPVAQGESIEMLPDNLKVMIPLNRAALYWKIAASSLYDSVNEFISLITPNLVMADLSYARLGIREQEDDGDCWSISPGEELVKVLTSLKPCQRLGHLDLSGNSLTQDVVVKNLGIFFSPFSKLTYLSLSGSLPSNQNTLECISSSFSSLPRLQHLDLSGSGLNADTFGFLSGGLCSLTVIRILDLSHNQLSHGYRFDEGDTVEALDWICNFVHGTTSLREVYLTDNDFDGIDFDWDEIKDNAGLSKVELKAVQKKLIIEDDAGRALSESSEEFTGSNSASEEDDSSG